MICFVEPKMYALFADMNTIKLIGLDDGAQDLGVYTFIYGPTDAHYMALCLDRSTDTLYFSDLTRYYKVWPFVS